MISEQKTYKKGDWIVHIFYGLGQVIGKDKRELDGEKQGYLKVKTDDSLYWIPVGTDRSMGTIQDDVGD